MKNQIMLITYADSFGGNLAELRKLLDTYFREEIGAVHILPFFPSSGDRGFAPMTYQEVDPAFGSWDDIRELAEHYELMFDFMINHLSRRSRYFQDFLAHHDRSEYRDLFLRFKDFWPGGEPTEAEVNQLNKRKPWAPCIEAEFADGEKEKIWCTFEEEQMDLDLRKPAAWKFVEESLEKLMEERASMIRLDAFAFATKKYGTSCFFVEPDIWEMMDRVQAILDRGGVPMLPEIHDHYTVQQKIADHGHWVYDFALPGLVLHTLYTGSGRRLKHWLDICPKKCCTTLDTHDGIGMVDVKDLLSDEEIQAVCDRTREQGATFKMDFSEKALEQPVVYQIDCTYYSALGQDDAAYLCARAIQFFAPGIPQVYYVGLLAGENDNGLAERTGVPRNISRHNYTKEEAAQQEQKPVVQKLKRLMRFRNRYPGFEGPSVVEETPDDRLVISRCFGEYRTVLDMDLGGKHFRITYREDGADRLLEL